jgi:hypothetical protein
MSKVKVETQVKSEPLPNIVLVEKEGSHLVGVLKKKHESSTFPGNFSYLIEVEDTDAVTRLFDKETQTLNDVDISKEDLVWLKGTTVLNTAFNQIQEGEKVEIVYTGKGEAKKGRKAPYLFDVFKVED